MLAWVFGRCDGTADAVETPIGAVPSLDALDTDGLDLPQSALAELLKVDPGEWQEELPMIEEHFAAFGDRLPGELRDQLAALRTRLV